jgi:hypothetical protein
MATEQTAAHFKKIIDAKDAAIAELQEKLDEDSLFEDDLGDRDADPWKAWVECEHGIPDDPRQCPACEGTYSTIIRPERLLCGMCYHTEYPRFQAALEDVDGELEAAGRAWNDSEDDPPESPAKRQCLSGTQIQELD